MTEPAQRPLEVPVGVRELSPRAVELRQAAVEDDARNEEVARPRIEAHIATCRMVAGVLQSFHEQIADTRDLELDGYSRPAAIWLVAGRCLGLLHAFLVQIAAGICTEALVTARSLHEANRLVFIFTQSEGEDLLRVWLDDEGRFGYVKPGQARASEDEFETMLNRVLDQKGMPTVRKTTDLVERMYDMLSRTAHNRRSSCLDSVWLPARQMAYGYHPSPCAAPRTRLGRPR